MDFKRPERCQRQRTGREDRRSKFYEISDNLHATSYAIADIGDLTLERTRQGGLDAIALAQQVAEGHSHRVMTQSKWALPRDSMKLVPTRLQRILREHERG